MSEKIVVIRTPSGISGDMLLTGLYKLAQTNEIGLKRIIEKINIPNLKNSIKVVEHNVNGILGWRSVITLPVEHVHRSYSEILKIIENSELESEDKKLSIRVFELLAKVESEIHNIEQELVTFHEVGSLDSILDVCVSAVLFNIISPTGVFCSPLPICDGEIRCAHGKILSPAPAVQEMLRGVPIYGIPSKGETVTPTALAILKTLDTEFGKWPTMTVNNVIRSYGSRVIENVPNGALFVLGERESEVVMDDNSLQAASHSI